MQPFAAPLLPLAAWHLCAPRTGLSPTMTVASGTAAGMGRPPGGRAHIEKKRSVKREGVLPYLWMLQACLLFTLMVEQTQLLSRYCYWQATAIARGGLVLLLVWFYARLTGMPRVEWRSRVLWMRS